MCLLSLQLQRSLETKCGPAFHVLVHDVTRLPPCDLLVADNRGSLVLFCDGQISKQTGSVSGATSQIVGLEVQETASSFFLLKLFPDSCHILLFRGVNMWFLVR